MAVVKCKKCKLEYDANMPRKWDGEHCLECNPSQEKDPNWCDICNVYFACEHTRPGMVKKQQLTLEE